MRCLPVSFQAPKPPNPNKSEESLNGIYDLGFNKIVNRKFLIKGSKRFL